MQPLIKPKSKIEIRIKCNDLPSKDLLSKSDPQAIVYLNGNKVGKTEKIKNDNSPSFKQSITVPYNFEEIQLLKFILIDIDGDVDFDENDKIGETNITLAKILSNPGGIYSTELKKNGLFAGTIKISTEEIHETHHNIVFKLEGHNLDKKDLFSSDPYFNIYKQGGTLVYKSDVIKNSLNPIYPPVLLKLEELNGGDMFRELTFEFMDWDKVGDHDLIGRFTVNTDTLLRGEIREFPLINPKKVGKSGYKNSGIIKFYECSLRGESTFLDYLLGGMEINLTVAIDCTASNGISSQPHSLHHNTLDSPSQYAKTIMTVGNVLAPYDYDQLITVIGFGGEYNGHTNHCFPFNLNPNGDTCNALGVQGVLDVYNKFISNINLSYPTNFEPVLSHVIKKASKHSASDQKYSVLLIISDGDISDKQDTIDALCKASNEPISVVIVGVGDHDFSAMNILDGDEKGLVDSHGKHAKRDICQFIPFKRYEYNLEALARETLSEIPSQVLSYMNYKKILPNPPRQFIA